MGKTIFRRISKHFRKHFRYADRIGYEEANKIIRKHGSSKQREIKKIAFFILSFANFKHFENIFKHLPNNLFDIVYNCKDADQLKAVAAENHYSCRSLASVLAKNEMYSIAVSSMIWFGWHLNKFLPILIAKKHIRFKVSIGSSLDDLSHEQNYIYDKILCYGSYQKKILEKRTDAEVISVGNPALDSFFWETFDRSSIKNQLIKGRKTIAWLTTIHSASSLEDFLPIMEGLSSRYNVFVNPHPSTPKEDFDLLANSTLKDQIVADDNLALLAEADFVICDHGGAAFRALYLDKNILLFNPTSPEKSFLTNDESPSVFLRSKIKSFDSTQARDIEETLRDDNYWKEQKEIRKQLFSEFFADERGTSSYKIARILQQDLLKNG